MSDSVQVRAAEINIMFSEGKRLMPPLKMSPRPSTHALNESGEAAVLRQRYFTC